MFQFTKYAFILFHSILYLDFISVFCSKPLPMLKYLSFYLFYFFFREKKKKIIRKAVELKDWNIRRGRGKKSCLVKEKLPPTKEKVP